MHDHDAVACSLLELMYLEDKKREANVMLA
jgi:hypothetical protein